MSDRKGKGFETSTRKFLEENFRTPLVFKLINTERMDFIVLDLDGGIHLVEAKETKKKIYYTKSEPKKREQLHRYFHNISLMQKHGINCSFWLYTKINGQTKLTPYKSYDDIPPSIKKITLKVLGSSPVTG
jgi:hypothetical protein